MKRSETDTLKVWKIEKLIFKDTDYIPNVYESAFIIYSSNNNSITINYKLNKRALSQLQEKWSLRYKDLKLEKVSILQEATYSIKDQNLYFSNILTDYIVEGENTESLNKKLSDLVYDERIEESPGVIGLLLERKYPNVIQDIAKIQLKEDIPYRININEDIYTITGEDTEMELLYRESYQWIGY